MHSESLFRTKETLDENGTTNPIVGIGMGMLNPNAGENMVKKNILDKTWDKKVPLLGLEWEWSIPILG